MSSLSASEQLAELEYAPPADNWAIRAENLSVTYRTPIDRRPTLKKTVARMARRQRTVKEVQALRDISLQIPHGSVVGVIGVNGAGKSTLMRTLAGILPPTRGRIEVNGRVSTLLALGVGFNADLSGRENVVLGGLAAGLSREAVEAKYDEIAEFAGLGEFMDVAMRNYSSGMYGRLAFSVAVNMEPDILLIDEALSVGDARFKRKSFDKMRELCAEARTILIVSHALKSLTTLCSEAIWLNEGRIMMRDTPEAVIEAYTRFLDVGEADEVDEDV